MVRILTHSFSYYTNNLVPLFSDTPLWYTFLEIVNWFLVSSNITGMFHPQVPFFMELEWGERGKETSGRLLRETGLGGPSVSVPTDNYLSYGKTKYSILVPRLLTLSRPPRLPSTGRVLQKVTLSGVILSHSHFEVESTSLICYFSSIACPKFTSVQSSDREMLRHPGRKESHGWQMNRMKWRIIVLPTSSRTVTWPCGVTDLFLSLL